MFSRTAAKRLAALAGFAGGSLAASVALFGTGTTPLTSAAATAAGSGPDLTRLPLGDGRVTTGGPRRDYVHSCQDSFGMAGASANGPWIHGTTWDATQKYAVDGDVRWPSAHFAKRIKKAVLRLSGNGLPTNHGTGVFPIDPGDDAYGVDRNPNSIRAQALAEKLSTRPKRARRASCLGLGMIGVMRNGVALFDALDGGGKDAAAHEVQDSCSGHPQQSGVYHYHSLPACLGSGRSGKQSKLIGWALDGFPIYGPLGKGGRYLSNADLDECHGTTGKVSYLGKKRTIYHYVANYEYPYTLGCYRGTPVTGTAGGTGGPVSGGGPPPSS